jgi:cytochrome c oxidase subunit 3
MTTQTDTHGARLGMWLFLFSELLLFGGLFLLYAVYLARYPADFAAGGQQLDTLLGTGNTLLLITSSLTVALALSALQQGRQRLCQILLCATVVASLLFLSIKGIEWQAKFGHGIFPGSPEMQALPVGQQIFFSLYFVTTGLHGLHVLVGAALLLWTLGLTGRSQVTTQNSVILENSALYWHLVDLIWIFIFPLYYLLL